MIAGLPPAIHRHCITCKIRTFCGALWCGDDRRHWGPQKPETPSHNPTIDFDLTAIPLFSQNLSFAVQKIYGYQGEGEPDITIVLKFPYGEVKPTITVNLPDKIKLPLKATPIIRENGTLRLEKPAKQEGLFEK